MQELINIFTKKRYFIRIYETSKDFIFWNDIDIYKKIPKTKIIDILNTPLIEKFANELITSINEQINAKYTCNNKKVSVIVPNYNNE